jgi:hypothetical protein
MTKIMLASLIVESLCAMVIVVRPAEALSLEGADSERAVEYEDGY